MSVNFGAQQERSCCYRNMKIIRALRVPTELTSSLLRPLSKKTMNHTNYKDTKAQTAHKRPAQVKPIATNLN